jgi:virulence factor Mce-like protein
MTRRAHRPWDRTRLFGILGLVAICVLATIGYVSYTALSGLPFQRRYHVSVEVPNANRLIATNDVRVGGIRVGQVSRVVAQPASRRGRPFARVDLAVEPSVGRLPVDTTVKVRPASVLGATYVELTLGRSRNTVPERGTLPLTRAARTVELPDLFGIFDRSTKRNFRRTVVGLSSGLAGRGRALNSTIGSFSGLMPPLTRVARVLAAPQTRLSDFLRAYASSADAFAPVSSDFARLVTGSARTFDALARERESLAQTMESLPPAEQAATEAVERVRPGLDGLAKLMSELEPAGRLLPGALARINRTLTAGVRPLRALPPFSGRLQTALSTLLVVSRLPETSAALRKLTDLMAAIDGVLQSLTPAQVSCNIIPLFFQGYASYSGVLGSGQGPSLSNLGIATTGASGEGTQSKEPAPDLNVNYIPHENAQECEAGNERAVKDQRTIGNPPGLQPARTRDTSPPPGVRERAQRAGLIGKGATG